jgi:hypothetical protein
MITDRLIAIRYSRVIAPALMIAALSGRSASAQVGTSPSVATASAPIDAAKLTRAQFEALPPDAQISSRGKIFTKRDIAARKAEAERAGDARHKAEAVKEQAELAADQARLKSEKQAQLAAARAQLRPQIERVRHSAEPAAPTPASPAEVLRVRAAVLLLQSKDPARAAAAELEAKRLVEQSTRGGAR